MTEREHIEELHQKYLSLRQNTPEMQKDGAESRAYHEWYDNAYVYFKSFESLLKNPDFQAFVNAEKDGNCFVLAHVYDTISPSYKVLMKITENLKDDNTETMTTKPYKVFISHSSKDKEFVEALVELLESIGFDPSTLFCSSVDGYGIGLSKDIFETLRGLFKEYNLYVIFVHSPNYYLSPVSLNEMGAAWVLKTDFCSFLTTNMSFDGMKGVVNGSTISIKVDNADAPARLTELKDHLLSLFGLNDIDSIKWERKRKAFLEKVTSIQYIDEVSQELEEESIELAPNEIEVLRQWVESDYPYSLQQNFMGNRTVYYLGRNGYETLKSEEKAEWEDFFERLTLLGFNSINKYDKYGHPQYKLKKAAFDYIKSLS